MVLALTVSWGLKGNISQVAIQDPYSDDMAAIFALHEDYSNRKMAAVR
jgi:hypothetical protein